MLLCNWLETKLVGCVNKKTQFVIWGACCYMQISMCDDWYLLTTYLEIEFFINFFCEGSSFLWKKNYLSEVLGSSTFEWTFECSCQTFVLLICTFVATLIICIPKVFDLAEMETRRYEDQSFVKFLEAGNEIEAFVSKFERCVAKRLPNSFAQTKNCF